MLTKLSDPPTLVLMGWGSHVAVLGIAASTGALTGCFTHDGWAKAHNREALMKSAEECNGGNVYSCKTLGDHLLGKSLQSRTSDWHQGHDRAGAKRAYRRACLLGDPGACAAIVEYALFDSNEEKAVWELRTAYHGGAVRTADELASVEAKLREERAAKEAELRATRRAEEADSQRSWAAFGQGLQQMQPQIEATVNRAAGGTGTATQGPGLGGTPAAGTAPKPDCSSCQKDLSVCSGQSATSPACYLRMAEVNDCLATKTGCSKSPEAARAEAARLRKAAAEIKR